jgi:hypothetical protein
MSRSRRPTLEQGPSLTVVVVGGPEALIDATKHAALTATAARVVACDMKSAATRIAEVRPFAIVVSESVYGFDATEFDALARDVGARVIAIDPEGLSAAELRSRLLSPLAEALRAAANT